MKQFEVRFGLCAQCGPGVPEQPVAAYPNGLSLCEKHDNQVRSQHHEAYKKHPLIRERWPIDE